MNRMGPAVQMGLTKANTTTASAAEPAEAIDMFKLDDAIDPIKKKESNEISIEEK